MSKKTHNKEIRALGTQSVMSTDPDGKSRRVTGYAAVFNKRSELMFENGRLFYEIIRPGAFDNSDLSDVRALLNHDSNHLLARTKSKTLTLSQDDKGLAFEFDMPNSRNDVLEMVERGDLDQNSFAFFVAKGGDTWEQEDGIYIRYINNIEAVRDITLATYPAYPDTNVSVAERSHEHFLEAQKDEQEKPEEKPTEWEQEYRDRALYLLAH